MKFKPTIAAAASGKLGGIVFSHNRGGMYTRVLAVPTNPGTPQQEAVRSYMQQLSNAWNTVLTDEEREDWATYGQNVSWTDRIGETIKLTGNAMYIRSNLPRLQAGLARVDAAPVTYNLGDFSPVALAATAGDPATLSLTFDTGDDWVSEDGAALLLRTSRQQAFTVNYFKGPYRYTDKVEGDSGTPPTSPAAITGVWNAALGNKVFFAAAVTRADGRLSAPFRGFCFVG